MTDFAPPSPGAPSIDTAQPSSASTSTSPSPSTSNRRFSDRPVHHIGLGVLTVGIVWGTMLPGAPLRSLGATVALLTIVAVLALVARATHRSLWLIAGSGALLPWLLVRDSAWLAAVNVSLSGALVLTALSDDLDGSLLPSPIRLLRRWRSSLSASRFGPAIVQRNVVAALGRSQFDRGRAGVVARHATIGLCVAAVGVAVLASGDQLFASFLSVGDVLSDAAVRVAVGLGGGLLLVVGLGAARAHTAPDGPSRHVSTGIATTVIASLAAVITVYGAVQLIAVTAGAAYVEGRTGLTYAEWARSGFFQVTAIVAAAVVALLGARSAPTTAPRRALGIGATVLTLGTVGLVATAIIKLVVYTDRFGLTMLRLYTITFSVWLGLLAIATLLALLGSTARWLRPAVVSSLVIGAFAMNIANPERLVAEHNIARAAEGAELDVDYLGRLSADATPIVLAFLADERDTRTAELGLWCSRLDAPRSLVAANLSVRTAQTALLDTCSP